MIWIFYQKLMMIIRKTEEKFALEKKRGLIKGPVHLGAGQEAIAVGISQNLKKTNRKKMNLFLYI